LLFPAERLRFAARFFCQGSPLRSMNAKLRGLDSADVKRLDGLGRAFVFMAPLRVAWESK